MEATEVKSQIEAIGKQIDEKINLMNQKAEAGENISKENTKEIQKLVSSFSEMQKQLDEQQAEQKRNRMGGFMDEQKMPVDQIREAMESDKDFSEMRKKGKGKVTFEFPELKATLLTANVAPGTVIQPQLQPGIVALPLRTTILDILATAPTSANTIQYVQEEEYVSNAAYVKEGELKPEDNLRLTQKVANVETLATTLRVSKQLLDDLPGLVGYIQARAPRKMQYVKENAVLFGSGVDGQLEGITLAAAAFAPDLGGEKIQAPNNYDVLSLAGFQTTMQEYIANGVVLHAADLKILQLAKDSQNRYLFPELRETGTIDGMRVVSSHMAAMRGKFLAGDFALGAQLFQRQGLTIELFDQDRDNVVRNLITIRIEERHALAIPRPDAFVYGSFAAARAALAAA